MKFDLRKQYDNDRYHIHVTLLSSVTGKYLVSFHVFFQRKLGSNFVPSWHEGFEEAYKHYASLNSLARELTQE